MCLYVYVCVCVCVLGVYTYLVLSIYIIYVCICLFIYISIFILRHFDPVFFPFAKKHDSDHQQLNISAYLLICISICLSVYRPVAMHMCMCVYVFVCEHVSVPQHLNISVCHFIVPWACLCVCAYMFTCEHISLPENIWFVLLITQDTKVAKGHNKLLVHVVNIHVLLMTNIYVCDPDVIIFIYHVAFLFLITGVGREQSIKS